MSVEVSLETIVRVDGKEQRFGGRNLFDSPGEAFAQIEKLSDGQARGIVRALTVLLPYEAQDSPPPATEPSPVAAPVVTDAQAAAHAEELRNLLRTSRQVSVESAKLDDQQEQR